MFGQIFVVETSDDSFIGTVEFVRGGLFIHNGFVGRPKFVETSDLVRIVPAEEHPEVELDTLPEFGTNDYFWVG